MSRRLASRLAGCAAAVTVLSCGVGALPASAASHHTGSAAQASCSLSGSVVGARLSLAGSGFAPGGSYQANFMWPDGSESGLMTTASSSGTLSVSVYADGGSGTVTVDVLSGTHQVATCSAYVS